VEPLDPTRVKERFFQVDETARKLLGDFRQVECNCRALGRETRERIATSDEANRRILQLIRGIERRAVAPKDTPARGPGIRGAGRAQARPGTGHVAQPVHTAQQSCQR
jgi:hypothetical protein